MLYDSYLYCAEFSLDNISDSETTITFNEIGDEITEETPHPEPRPDCIPEITFTSTALMLQELRTNPYALFM